MLIVKTPSEALSIIEAAFAPCAGTERVPLRSALGRALAGDAVAHEHVPGFDRSTVDGYAARAADTFGCSESIPAMLSLRGEIAMGEAPGFELSPGECAAIATGGPLPRGADAVVMIERAERAGPADIAVSKSVAPGENVIFRGDDVRPGAVILRAGQVVTPRALGALAASGIAELSVARPLVAGIISTGDELVPADRAPGPGEVRDVNSHLLCGLIAEAGGEPRDYGIIPDDEQELGRALDQALAECGMVVISGGSSVGERDATRRAIEARGEILFHGLAMKPGKPTMLGRVNGAPVFGLPGHPLAACFTAMRFVIPLITRMTGRAPAAARPIPARLTEAVAANDGREQCVAVTLRGGAPLPDAFPLRAKSGLITSLASADGWFVIPAESEGFPGGTEVNVLPF